MPGYTMLQCDHLSNPSDYIVGGGVAIYINQNILFEQHILVGDIEYICVVIRRKGVRFGYRPSYVRHTCLTALVHSFFVDLAVIMLYFWGLLIYFQDQIMTASLYSRMNDFSLYQAINELTRITITQPH